MVRRLQSVPMAQLPQQTLLKGCLAMALAAGQAQATWATAAGLASATITVLATPWAAGMVLVA